MPVNVVSIKPGRRRRSGPTENVQGIFSLDVDQTSVQQLLTMVNVALSPSSLTIFMKRDVQPFLADVMVDRFAYNGTGGVNWAPLAESTLRIRQEMGQTDDDAINDRTGEMLQHLISNSEVTANANVTVLAVPGDQGDEVMRKKIQTAQHGNSEWNPLFGEVSHTPARPVLDINDEDRAAIVIMLQTHVMNLIGALSAPLGSF